MTRSLKRLLHPKSIAVIGGGVWCERAIAGSRSIGFAGPIWPVHPTRDHVAGEKAFASVADLPGVPDAVFIAVNRTASIELVAELSQLGAGAAVCLASGFAEVEAEDPQGPVLQRKLVEAAGEMVLIGPNCYGLINYLDGAMLWPDQHGGERVDSGVAVLTQSSNVALNMTMQTRGLPIAYMGTLGNQAQTNLAQVGAAMLRDKRVTALGLHIEGFGDLRAFEALAHASVTTGKPIVVLKSGLSEAAQAATVSHTASLAGSGAGAKALLARLGMAQVTTLPEMMETLKLLHVAGPLTSNRIASMSCSGGEASLVADACEGRNVTLPALTDAQRERLRDALGPMVALSNPLDYHTYIWGDEAKMSNAFSAMLEPSLGLACVVIDYPREDRCSAQEWNIAAAALEDAAANSDIPMAAIATMPECQPEAVSKELIKKGIAPLAGLTDALSAIEHASNLGRLRGIAPPLLLPEEPGETVTLTENEAKARLAAYGVPVPRRQRAETPEEAMDAAMEIGFPVVLKGEGIAHKSEAGAVILNLMEPEEVFAAAETMPAESFLVEEMIPKATAELLVGVTLDPAHGYVLTLAAGGTLTELLGDRASLLIPASETTVLEALTSLRVGTLLNGFRGAEQVDMNAVIAAISSLQSFVVHTAGCVSEVEINPIICTPNGAVAADALVSMNTSKNEADNEDETDE
ncbi:MAG: acetate--CoA ligase family protein [Pseudomonadota bacterium]